MVVLDASVVLKWALRDEAGAAQALEYRERHRAGIEPAAVPEVLFYEAANAIVCCGRLTADQAEAAWNGLLAVDLAVYSLRSSAMCRAMELARLSGAAAYDTCYVALAEALGCDFVTADRKLARKLKGQGLRCRVRTL
ncbi:MAG TPA: type II toxin-antitoxin system VapC family toxin [Planctomycetota bacterium]|nr:type II toxin-antitoxin system VapC family toxin [Planctomycetota bacterium]HRR83229.1 type II toxin-antitoxin system VapC family toxin [Planctomycetota bacterium]HRT96900.1 type II toxin-antitoxin system VapC family toxin [Planctomycetota bacterium]